jgi:lysophospholipase L1-like esterase
MWAGNPSNSENLTRHNLELMQAADKDDARLFDIDRLIWAAGTDTHVTSDGIHLTAKGHRLFANQVPLMFR